MGNYKEQPFKIILLLRVGRGKIYALFIQCCTGQSGPINTMEKAARKAVMTKKKSK